MIAIIFDATGMVGSDVLHLCLENKMFEKIITIGRRATGIQNSNTYFSQVSLPQEVEVQNRCYL